MEASSYYRLPPLYDVFIRTEMDKLVEELEADGRNKEADRVLDIRRELRDICHRKV